MISANAQTNILFQCLQESYPQIKIESEKRSIVVDDRNFLFDDGLEKDFQTLLNEADIEDMFHYRYIPGEMSVPESDPGRIRHEGFFKALYGDSPEAVKKNLVTVPWMPESGGGTIQITKVNGVAEEVQAISAELDVLPEEFKKYVLNPAGGYKWRKILDTERLSVHSFGIAIDIDASLGHYWKWDLEKNGKIAYQNQIPQEIVDIFERHGFIWGGKWHHYDTMHFEYRPELFCYTKSR